MHYLSARLRPSARGWRAYPLAMRHGSSNWAIAVAAALATSSGPLLPTPHRNSQGTDPIKVRACSQADLSAGAAILQSAGSTALGGVFIRNRGSRPCRVASRATVSVLDHNHRAVVTAAPWRYLRWLGPRAPGVLLPRNSVHVTIGYRYMCVPPEERSIGAGRFIRFSLGEATFTRRPNALPRICIRRDGKPELVVYPTTAAARG